MPMVTDANFVRDKFDEVFEIEHDRKESFRDKYHRSQFHIHQSTPSQGGTQSGPIEIQTTPEGTKLVRIVLSSQIGGEGREVEERLQELRKLLVELLEPGERCQLFVENDSHAEDIFTREARGYVAPP